jgi:hypothetical protein
MFWDVTPCSLVDIHWHFGELYFLHLQGWLLCLSLVPVIIQSCKAWGMELICELWITVTHMGSEIPCANNTWHWATCFLLVTCLAYSLTLKMEAVHGCECQWTFLHGITSQKMVFFIVTTVKIWFKIKSGCLWYKLVCEMPSFKKLSSSHIALLTKDNNLTVL